MWNPMLSPDNSHLFYRKIGGGYLTSGLWSNEPGIYMKNLNSGKSEKILDAGTSLHFANNSHDLYFFARGSEGKRHLKSIHLKTRKITTHYTSENATEMHISPDGKWLAYRERFKVFVTPFIHLGKDISIDAKKNPIPLNMIAKDAGEFLHLGC